MKFFKDSFKITPQVEPVSDKQREKLLKADSLMNRVAGAVFVAIGLFELLIVITKWSVPAYVQSIAGIIMALLLILFIVQGTRMAKYRLDPKDEYEVLQDAQAKARAYNFLSLGLFLMIVIVGLPSAEYYVPLIYILLGSSWLIIAKESGNTDARAKSTK